MSRIEAAAEALFQHDNRHAPSLTLDKAQDHLRDDYLAGQTAALAAADAYDAANGVHRNSLDEKAVLDFITERSEYVRVCRENSFGDNDVDYWRYQGHMEARRQLAQALGYTVPYEPGEKTVLAAAVKEDGDE